MEQGTEILAPSLVAVRPARGLVCVVFDLRLALSLAPGAMVVSPSTVLAFCLFRRRSVHGRVSWATVGLSTWAMPHDLLAYLLGSGELALASRQQAP